MIPSWLDLSCSLALLPQNRTYATHVTVFPPSVLRSSSVALRRPAHCTLQLQFSSFIHQPQAQASPRWRKRSTRMRKTSRSCATSSAGRRGRRSGRPSRWTSEYTTSRVSRVRHIHIHVHILCGTMADLHVPALGSYVHAGLPSCSFILRAF